MTPYETMIRLVSEHGIADILLMVSDICQEMEDHVAQEDERYWMRAGQVIRRAVKDLPKHPGIK